MQMRLTSTIIAFRVDLEVNNSESEVQSGKKTTEDCSLPIPEYLKTFEPRV